MLKQSRCILCATLLIALLSIAASAQQYTIRLDRPEKAGERYHLVATSTQTTTADAATSDLPLPKSEDVLIVELSADVTILEAASNWATRRRFTVLSSKFTRAGSTGPILPAGTEVIASIQNRQTVYEVSGKPVDAVVTKALRSVISLHLASVSDDDTFGTPTPKKIGGRWPVAIDAMKKLLKEMNAQGGSQEITGSGILEKVEGNHLFIKSSINVRDVLLPIAPGITTESGEIESELAGRYPLLQRDQTVESSGRIHISLLGSVVNAEGKKVKLHVVFESRSRYEIRPL